MAAASLFLGFGCKASAHIGSGEVAKEDVEAEVAAELAASVHQPTPNITCPKGLKAKVGASVDCELTAQGDTAVYPVHVVVDSVDNGTAHFNAVVAKQPK